MGTKTGIKWTHHTFNPWWGCYKSSPACQNCYAEAVASKFGSDVWGPDAPRRFFDEKHWKQPLAWNRQAEKNVRPHLVFCASMADVLEPRQDLKPERAKLWALINQTEWLEWQLLTKHPEGYKTLVPDEWLEAPPWNVWHGTTVENQKYLEIRAQKLFEVRANVRFLSCEPLLGPIDLGEFRPDWVIVGGESGKNFRPLNLDHARSLRDQCKALGIPFFFKQVGGPRPDSGGDLLDGERIQEFPKHYKYWPYWGAGRLDIIEEIMERKKTSNPNA